MFNGIIYKTGKIIKISKNKNHSEIVLKTNFIFKKSDIGSSLCCNGTCLTITKTQNKYISFYLSKETLKRTNFGKAKIGDIINIKQEETKIRTMLELVKKRVELRRNGYEYIDLNINDEFRLNDNII